MRLQGLSNLSCFYNGSEYTEFEIPAPFRRVVLNALTASPAAVDLRAQSPQFYRFAEKILNLYGHVTGVTHEDYGIRRTPNPKVNSKLYKGYCGMYIYNRLR